ncbi:MAG TPA: hypothetical protein VJ824_00945 [Bacillota bacterium]|nr:hypothetical protein [Bacillota bacterium]
MRQGYKEGHCSQTMVVGMTADLRDTSMEEHFEQMLIATTMLPGEGRKLVRQIGR